MPPPRKKENPPDVTAPTAEAAAGAAATPPRRPTLSTSCCNLPKASSGSTMGLVLGFGLGLKLESGAWLGGGVDAAANPGQGFPASLPCAQSVWCRADAG